MTRGIIHQTHACIQSSVMVHITVEDMIIPVIIMKILKEDFYE